MGLYRATLHGSCSGQTVDVITGWSSTAADNVSDANILADRVYQGWADNYMPILSSHYEITSCDVIGMIDGTVAGFFSGSAAGADTSAPAPVFCVANWKLTTGLRGRSYTGRYGVPGLLESQTDSGNGNILNAGAISDLESAESDFVDHVHTGVPAFTQCVISTISGGTPRPVALGTPVVTAQLQTALGSRVSRKG